MNPFEQSNGTNHEWQLRLQDVLEAGITSNPRGMEVKELINGHYTVPMPAFLDLAERDVRAPFMFAEAAWIISGSNRLEDLTPYMKFYSNFSDDGRFLRGAYGPKVIDQLPYVIDTLIGDNDSRQAVMTIWRERPGPSKDIPCTVAAQFLIRNNVLHMVTTMRSNDIVLGFTYDVFTFSMIANAVRVLLKERGVDVILGDLHVNAGSLHLYEKHYEQSKGWITTVARDMAIGRRVFEVMKAETYTDLIKVLKDQAHDAKFYPERYRDV